MHTDRKKRVTLLFASSKLFDEEHKDDVVDEVTNEHGIEEKGLSRRTDDELNQERLQKGKITDAAVAQ